MIRKRKWLLFVYENECWNDATLPNENNIKTIMMPSETYRNENVSSENKIETSMIISSFSQWISVCWDWDCHVCDCNWSRHLLCWDLFASLNILYYIFFSELLLLESWCCWLFSLYKNWCRNSCYITMYTKIAKWLKLCEVHSFSTSPNSHHHTTVLNADVPNCYTML